MHSNSLKLLSRWRHLSAASRQMSSNPAQEMIKIEHCEDTRISTIKLVKKPANLFCLDFSRQFSAAIHEIEHGKLKRESKALLIVSGLTNGIFSGGFDLEALYDGDHEKIKELWTGVQDVWIDIFQCSLPTAVAMNGHAIAGGAIPVITADYRVMVNNPKYKTGLNEAAFGLVPPEWLMDGLRASVGHRRTEKYTMNAALINPQEALDVGLIDELADTEEVAVEKAKSGLQRLLKIDAHARHQTKLRLR